MRQPETTALFPCGRTLPKLVRHVSHSEFSAASQLFQLRELGE